MSYWDPWGDYPEAARQSLRARYPGLWRLSVAVRIAFVVSAIMCAAVWGIYLARLFL